MYFAGHLIRKSDLVGRDRQRESKTRIKLCVEVTGDLRWDPQETRIIIQ